jgi:LacI family transcriptional regulator, galactose operon repressor
MRFAVSKTHDRRPVTIDDVARLAGVSRQTVSRAINDKPEIDPQTRDRILRLAQEIGYRPSRFARGMVRRDMLTLGLIIADVLNPFFPEVTKGVLDAAEALGWQVVVHTPGSRLDKERAAAAAVTSQADACVAFLSDGDAIQRIAASGMPFVLLDKEGRALSVPGVRIDFEVGVLAGMAHLVERGHTRIAMMDDQDHFISGAVDTRRNMYLSYARSHRLPIDESWVLPAVNSLEGGAAAIDRLRKEHPDATAVFAYNDLIAIGAMRRALALGLSVPGDLAVVGFDGLMLGELVDPPLTTLHIDKRRLGSLAVEQIAALIATGHAVKETVVVPHLVVRRST